MRLVDNSSELSPGLAAHTTSAIAYRVSKDVVAGAGSGDDLSRKVYASYQQFLPSIIDWSEIAEGAFLNSRRLT